jgi:photosystem II stability/assembly factor-like uncharacterized protein
MDKNERSGWELIISDREGTLYAASNWRLYRSTDGGTDWSPVTEIGFYGTGFGVGDEGAFTFVVSKGGSVFAIDIETMFRSQNGIWKPLARPRPRAFPDFRTLAADSLGNVLVGSTHGLYLINEESDTGWVTLRNPGDITSIAYSSAGYWFCAERSRSHDTCRILRTRKLAAINTQWDTVYQYSPFSYPAIYYLSIAPSGEIVAVGNGGVILRSSDNGTTWTADSIPPIGRIRFLGDNGGMLATSRGAGPMRSTDGGRSWQNSFSGMKNLPIDQLAISPSGTLFVATIGRGIYRSVDRGMTWEPAFDSSAYHYFYTITRTRNGSLLAATSTIYRSSDEGNSWKEVFSYSGQALRLVPSQTGMIYGYRDRLPMIRSTDDGRTWETLENSPSGSGYDWGRPIEDSTRTLWWHDWNGFIRSTDNGESWDTTAVPDPATHARVMSMAVQPSGAIVAATDSGMIRSVDSGRSWTILSKERPGGRGTMKIASVGDDNLFVADSGRSLYLSTNSGKSWRPVPIPNQHWNVINTIASDTTGYVYLATSKGVFRSREPQVLSSVQHLPDTAGKLSVEYRNGLLIVRWNIEATDPVWISITTLDGRQTGSYDLAAHATQLHVELPAPDLIAGVYLCQIHVRDIQLHRKLIVVR